MSGDSFGRAFRVTTYGESHGEAVGAVIEGCPPGFALSLDKIQRELDRRRPGTGPNVSARNEPDRLEVVSGLSGSVTGAGPMELRVRNVDARPSDYDEIARKPRPGHGDMAHFQKHGSIPPGGGRYCGRETIGRVLAGAVAKQVLAAEDIVVSGNIESVRGARSGFDSAIAEAKARNDSVGGIISIEATGVPPGLGEPVFDKLDADLAKALMSIGGVKGVEIGAGFAAAGMLGSEDNDPIIVRDGKLATSTNNAGGILGGLSNGMPITCRIAVKPTSSIGIEQDTVDITTMEPARLVVRGRHDPCLCQRVLPVAEAMVAIVILDHLLRSRGVSDV